MKRNPFLSYSWLWIRYLYAMPFLIYMKKYLQKSNYWEVVAVNNAGTINKNNKTWNVPAEEFDTVVDTNIKGTANVLRHFIPLMLQKKHGMIINLSSGWGRSSAAEVGRTQRLFNNDYILVTVKSSLDTELRNVVSGCSLLCFQVGYWRFNTLLSKGAASWIGSHCS
jgi:hypothetical protein